MRDATPRQQRMLYEIDAFTGVYGRHPSWAELGALLGVCRQTAKDAVHWLQKKCLLDGRRLTDDGRKVIADWLAPPPDGTVPSGGTRPEI